MFALVIIRPSGKNARFVAYSPKGREITEILTAMHIEQRFGWSSRTIER